MGKSSKLIVIAVLALTVIATGLIFSGCQKTEKQTVKIGLALPLTGAIGWLGEGMRDAAIIAQEQLKDTRYNYELFFEDDQYNPTLTATIANKFINIDKVDAIVSCEAAPGQVVSALARKNDFIHFGLTAVESVAEGDNNFVHWTPAKEQARVLVKELKRRGIKKIGVFRSVSLEDWTAYVDAVKREIQGTEMQIVTDQSFTDDTNDFRGMIAMAKATNPDIYFFVVMSPALELLTKQMREMGVTTPLTAIESFEVTKESSMFEGYFYVSAAEPTSGFAKAYEAKYGIYPPLCAANSYDMINLLVKAYENVKTDGIPTTAQVAAELKKIQGYPGALGPLSIGDNGIVISNAQLKTIKNGKPTPVGH